jgi:hypothetical protein
MCVHVCACVCAVKKMDELMGHMSSGTLSEELQTKLLSVEISLLFSGFEKLDKTHDGFLSPFDLVRFCREFSVNLREQDISAMMWLMDDHRRGKLTFDDVMKFYIRNREEFLKSGEEFHRTTEEMESSPLQQQQDKAKDKEQVIQAGFGAFGVENATARGRTLDGGMGEEQQGDEGSPHRSRRGRGSKRREEQGRGKFMQRRRPSSASAAGGRKQAEEVTVASGDLRAQPLLLFRILFFVSMQSTRGEIHLLSAFQTLSQLFGRAAEEKFNCIFLRNFLTLQDADRVTLRGFVEHMKQHKLSVKRARLQVRCFK